MPKSDKPGMIDGFMSVQAVRHKGEHKPDDKSPPGKSPPEKQEETQSDSVPLQKKASIGHTAMPSRHELVCYSCGYAFVVTGKLGKVFCSKCREELETGNHEIEGEWKQDIRTVGRVHIKSGATIDGATVIATDIVIAGDCSKANLQPTRRIELETGAIAPPGVLDAHPVLIRAGARLSLKKPLHCFDLDIHGELQADAAPNGTVTIHPGGMFRGKLKAAHLVVHDGGGLSADLHIKPEEPEVRDPKPEAGGQKTEVGAPKSAVGTSKAKTPKGRASRPGEPPAAEGSAGAKRRNTPPAKPKAASKPASKRVSSAKGKKRTSKRTSKKVE